MDKLTKILAKLVNAETVTYVFFGVLTTIVNLICFKVFDLVLGDKLYLLSNAIAWVAAVVFAYVTNKLFVFESKSWSVSVLKKEIPSFLGARVLSFFIEEGGMFLFVDLLGFDRFGVSFSFLKDSVATGSVAVGGKMLAKLIVAVVVVILNYFFSKLFIFKKDSDVKKAETEEG